MAFTLRCTEVKSNLQMMTASSVRPTLWLVIRMQHGGSVGHFHADQDSGGGGSHILIGAIADIETHSDTSDGRY